MNISICLATYNGSRYVKDQVLSILPQLSEGDELIVVDDMSTDDTVDIINNFESPYITIIKNDRNIGHVKTFERLLTRAQNEIIFMCDQDDIWSENKIEIFKKYFIKENVLLISDNSHYIDREGKKITFDMVMLSKDDSYKYSKNIKSIYKGTAGYYGCAMAIKKEILDVVLPIPSFVESHDLWIAMTANLMKSNLHINNKTFFRRIHGENDSLKKRNFFKKIYSRYLFLKSQLILKRRIKKYLKKKN